MLREVEEILRRRPGLGVFVSQAKDLRAELSHAHGPSPLGASALTAAELRLLPMLSTHLSLPEIAKDLFLSHNTIKSETNSIYRKLGPPRADKRSPGPRSWGCWRADDRCFTSSG